MMPPGFEINEKDTNENRVRIITPSKMTAQTNGAAKKGAATGGNPLETLLRRRNMSRISEESNDPDVTVEKETTQPIHHFSNLVDSVHITENRLSFAQKDAHNLKSVKYIFPTSYIGTSIKSQETVNKSNSISAFTKNNQLKAARVKNSSGCYSGIPIPKNGFNGKNKTLTAISSVQRFMKPTEHKTKEVTRTLETLENTDMTMVVYIPSTDTSSAAKHSEQEHYVDSSSSASVITPPSEADTVAPDPEREQEGQTYK